MRVLIWVQHLWGVGHLRRATRIADALGGRGAEVTLVSGGPPMPDFETGRFVLRQLSPVQAGDATFRTLVRPGGKPADEAFMAGRARNLLRIFDAALPDVVITELFPFGRRKFRREALALLQAAHARRPRPLILSSLRDIIEPPSDPARIRDQLHWAHTFYDAVLVHGDPEFIPLEVSAPWTRRLRLPVLYTGYVTASATANPGQTLSGGAPEVLVSAGGGRSGARLLQIAAEAARLVAGGPRWRLVGGWHADATFSGRSERNRDHRSGPEIICEGARNDMPELLRHAGLAISRAGYNTLAESLAAGTRMILVPDREGGQREQTLRARRLAECGLALHMPEQGLTPASLAYAVAALLKATPLQSRIRLNGAAVTARMIETLFRRHCAARDVAEEAIPR